MKRKSEKEPNFPRQFIINWMKYYLAELNGGKAKTQITRLAVDEMMERIKLVLEHAVTYHQEYQLKLPNRRGNSIFEEDVVDFFDTYFRS